MNREIKFRVWDKYTKQFFTKIDFADANKGDSIGSNVIMFPVYPPREYIFQQFTGLKDGDGKEIYEGDILDFGDSDIQSIVWDERASAWGFSDGTLFNGVTVNNGEIIGNIFENPELIKDGNK